MLQDEAMRIPEEAKAVLAERLDEIADVNFKAGVAIGVALSAIAVSGVFYVWQGAKAWKEYRAAKKIEEKV